MVIPKIKVFIVDDHPVVREGLREIIQSQPDMEVVGEAAKGLQAIENAKQLKQGIDVMIIDISLPDVNGLEVVHQVKELQQDFNHQIKFLILSMYSNEKLAFNALNAGALGYVHKSFPASEILSAIKDVYRGKYHLSNDISAMVISEYLKVCKSTTPLTEYERLTKREKEVLRLLAEGMSTRQISELLFISRKTVEKHRNNIMSKLKVHSFAELMKVAIKMGVINVET